jgi:hypothetical protein
MKHTFQTKVIEGIDLKQDLLAWLPLLETAGNPLATFEEGSPILDLGPVEFARVSMAAVEQYAIAKKLNPGSTEPLRYRALNLYLSAASEFALYMGQTDILKGLAIQNSQLEDWVSSANEEIGRRGKEVWHRAALHAYLILMDISKQQSRRGKRGRVADGDNPTFELRNLVYAEIINSAGNSVSPSQRNDTTLIRTQIRAHVSDFLARGCLSYNHGLSTGENIDKHAKNVLRKFDADIERFIDEGKLHPSKRPQK